MKRHEFVPNGPINNIPALVKWYAPSHYLNRRWLIYRRIYASLGLNGLTQVKYQSGPNHTTYILFPKENLVEATLASTTYES